MKKFLNVAHSSSGKTWPAFWRCPYSLACSRIARRLQFFSHLIFILRNASTKQDSLRFMDRFTGSTVCKAAEKIQQAAEKHRYDEFEKPKRAIAHFSVRQHFEQHPRSEGFARGFNFIGVYTMRKSLFVIAMMAASTVVFAQATGGAQSQKSSNPNAVQIQGNTNIKANAENVNAVAVGEGNTAKNAVGAIKGGTQIQGNTNIKANAKNVNAVAVGKNNTATNDVGVIGGK